MRDTTSYVENPSTSLHDISVKNRANETKEIAVIQQAKKKGENLQFSPKVVIVPTKPVNRSVDKRMPTMHTSHELDEYLDSFP
jgi:hypothetical protein